MKKTKYLLLIILLIAVTFISMPRIVSAADETTSILKVKEIKIDSLSEKEEENKQDLSIYLINVTNNDVTWTSSDETVATVSADGWLTAKKEGTAIITVTVKDKNIKESCTVTITNEDSTGNTNNEEESQTTETWTDTSNIKIKLTDSTIGLQQEFKLGIEGITTNKDSEYYLYLTNGNNKPTLSVTDSNFINKGYYTSQNGTVFQNYFYPLSGEGREILEKNGDIYAWIVESKLDSNNKRENKFILEGYKVERPALLKLSTRFNVSFGTEYTVVSNYNINGSDNEERKLKVKIGTIDDNSILKSINVSKGVLSSIDVVYENDSGCLLEKGKDKKIEQVLSIPECVSAPITKGQKLGNITYFLDGEAIASTNLIADKDVKNVNLSNMFEFLFFSWFRLLRE